MKVDLKNPTAEITILWISLIGGAGIFKDQGGLEIGGQQKDWQLPVGVTIPYC